VIDRRQIEVEVAADNWTGSFPVPTFTPSNKRVLSEISVRCLFVAALLLYASAGQAVPSGQLQSAHKAKGVAACKACHKEAPATCKPPSKVCVTCHGDQAALAAKTSQASPNPHRPPHLASGETQDCNDCHHVHKESEVACVDCHRGFRFNLK
jgi:hypothetical protein